ncbi:hypothetical protein ACFP1I_21555 [Dyadobacter subterraneus]|uniref:Uncharacterized protein n=1 Tax=Dyadobacter subterraneus TaxID=2773304 RepID=A0ABR9W5B3_9BACT|nr:hypothetical protein [Dyadobacter subterraneus]MBE9460648.1 hypothetical protein [Dyadobacter subterraneus]
MIIERTKNEVIFRLPVTVNLDDLQDMADLFEFKELSKNATVSQQGVDDLVKKIKKGRWTETKSKLGL